MQLFENKKKTSESLSAFSQSTWNLKYFKKKSFSSEVISLWNYRVEKAELLKLPKIPVSELL